jgi:hypothetical protein
MYVKKIVAKNFIVPGVQKFEFDHLGGLVNGAFFNLDVIEKINQVLAGDWVNSTMSFEKYYPKFSYPAPDMSMELDALIQFNDFERDELNKILKSNGFTTTELPEWYLTIKCFYPYIFPVVTMAPAKDDGSRDKNKLIGVGNHYEKFVRTNATKRDILSVSGFYTVSKFREEYYKYKLMDMDPEVKDLHNEYLKLLKSVFRYDEQFIKRIGKIFYAIDDGDIINYGDQHEFFNRNPEIAAWYDSIEILRRSPEIKNDFSKLLWEHFYSNLQINYTVKSSNEVIDIKKILLDSNCLRPLDYRTIAKLIKFKLSDEPLEVFDVSKKSNLEVQDVKFKVEEGLNLDEDTVNILNQFDDLTVRHEEITEIVEAEARKLSRKEMKEAKKANKNVAKSAQELEDERKAAEEQKALQEEAKVKRIQERELLRREKELRRNPKIVVIDSEHITSELIKWD